VCIPALFAQELFAQSQCVGFSSAAATAQHHLPSGHAVELLIGSLHSSASAVVCEDVFLQSRDLPSDLVILLSELQQGRQVGCLPSRPHRVRSGGDDHVAELIDDFPGIVLCVLADVVFHGDLVMTWCYW